MIPSPQPCSTSDFTLPFPECLRSERKRKKRKGHWEGKGSGSVYHSLVQICHSYFKLMLSSRLLFTGTVLPILTVWLTISDLERFIHGLGPSLNLVTNQNSTAWLLFCADWLTQVVYLRNKNFFLKKSYSWREAARLLVFDKWPSGRMV